MAAKVLEECQITPPSEALIPQTPLPLTFFDIPWLRLPPVQRLFFYQSHHSITHFMNSILPNLKHSLSLTLQHFYPLLGNLTWPLYSALPQLIYKDGDSVPLTVAESTHDFNHLIGDHPRNNHDFYHLVPQLPIMSNERVPLLALQITLFPNSGICVGITINHVVADGRTSNHFIKSWASVCRSGGDTAFIVESLPFFDRTVIKDPDGLEMIYLKNLEQIQISQKCFHFLMNAHEAPVDRVRATFVMSRADIEKLKQWVVARLEMSKQVLLPTSRLSKFVLTYAYLWVCLVKARRDEENVKEWQHLLFPVDCTARLDPPLPITYFGNCLMACILNVKTKDIIGEDGIAIAAESIGNEVQRMNEVVLRDAQTLLVKLFSLGSEQILSIAGSPKLAVYETDFGWGRPKKVEVISIDTGGTTGAISLSERRDGEDGLEVGIVLNKLEMDAFASLFVETLKIVS